MAKVCEVNGKKGQMGYQVSHSQRHTLKKFQPNLHTLKMRSDILGCEFPLKMSSQGLRTLTKHGGLDGYIAHARDANLTPELKAIKRLIAKKQVKAPAAATSHA